jgi:hypothetical protein
LGRVEALEIDLQGFSHEGGDGEAFRQAACRHGLEGILSKRLDRAYLPGDRGASVLGEASYGNVVLSCGVGNHVDLLGLLGGAEGIRTSDLRSAGTRALDR